MSAQRYRYTTEDFRGRPSAEDLDRRARDGWRLVSVVGHPDGSTAYFERPIADGLPEGVEAPAGGPARRQVESFHRQMIKMLQAHGNLPELQRIADGVEHFHHELVAVLRERLGDHPELADLSDDETRLAEALLALRHVAQNGEDEPGSGKA